MTTRVVEQSERLPTSSLKFRAWGRAFRQAELLIGVSLVVILFFACIFAPELSSKNPLTMYPNGISAIGGPLGPSKTFLLGTDQFGRDELSRLLWGGRTAILVSVFSSMISAVLGLVLGTVAAMNGGWVDTLISRFINILMSFPLTLFAVAMVMILRPNVWNLIVVMSIIFWTYTARLIRAEVMTLKELEFITAAKTLGAGNFRILVTHIIPNVIDTVFVRFTLSVAQAFLLESGLSYLGVGVQPPAPDWGLMIAQSQDFYAESPTLVLFPGLAIVIAVIAFNLLGNGLKNAFSRR